VCREQFPDAHTQEASIAWYRVQVKKAAASAHGPAIASDGHGLSSLPIKGTANWPEWGEPGSEDLLQLARLTAPYIRFLRPEIVRAVVEDNEAHRASWERRLAECDVAPALYLWDKCPCAFPGVRRYAGSAEIAGYRGQVAVEEAKHNALALDDNDYPKQLWSFVFLGRKFPKHGPPGYSLAHLADHKEYKNRARSEFIVADAEAPPLTHFGLYTSAANTVYLPRGLIRPTDFSFPLRNLIQRKAEALYGGFCNLLPRGLSIREAPSTDWALDAFKWPDPVGTVERVHGFLDYRRREMERLFAKPLALLRQIDSAGA
jgi:hypothetical protein